MMTRNAWLKLVSLLLLFSFWGSNACVLAQSKYTLKAPTSPRQASKKKPRPMEYEPDVLLVMPNAKADEDDINQAIKEANGKVIEKIGEGPGTVLVIQTEKGKLDQTEKSFSKNKDDFSAVQRNWLSEPRARTKRTTTTGTGRSEPETPNDPAFPSEWHLWAVNAMKAWKISPGNGVTIAVLDSGVNRKVSDLAGKTYPGYDAFNNVEGQAPTPGGFWTSHGTECSTTAAAILNNKVNTVGVAPNIYIYPIRICSNSGKGDTKAEIRAMIRCKSLGIKIVSFSYGGEPPYHFSNPKYAPDLDWYFRDFHDKYGGLIFNSIGNGDDDGNPIYDNNPRLPYLIEVTATEQSGRYTSWSNWGKSLWFAAPGEDIYCSNHLGETVSVPGTSFSTPICAAIAAMVWAANPGLRNTDVENIMIKSCTNYTPGWNELYGYGVPDAEVAVKYATGR